MRTNLQARVLRNAKRRGVKIRLRHQWGSQFPKVYAARLTSRRVTKTMADTYVMHITVTPDSGRLTGDFDKDMRTIERIGMERFSSGFSYNFGIDMKTGMVGVGQLLMAKGTHTVNDKNVPGFSHDQNAVARAFAWIGMPGDKISDEAVEAAAQLMAALIEEGALTSDPDFLPHSFFAAKDCPTQAGRDALPRIKRRALYLVGRG